mmetsp:Transcript_56681/g.149363  ORF Transcript_56681/g.149363 Transcript_56681/m.149363 type:complete len:96 (-) Transcript_56681:278-565(-)
MEKKLNVRRLNDVISVSSQIHEKDIAEIAKLGFRTIINNRPDQEGGDIQPFSADLGTAAASRGIEYHYLHAAQSLFLHFADPAIAQPNSSKCPNR